MSVGQRATGMDIAFLKVAATRSRIERLMVNGSDVDSVANTAT